MSQGKNLSVQRCAGPESLPNRRKERANDREHGLSKLSREPFKFNLLNENRVFSRDRHVESEFHSGIGDRLPIRVRDADVDLSLIHI